MLEVTELQAFYGDSHVLQGIGLGVASGQRVAVLGRNGAGKTTLLKSIMNAGPRTGGRIAWDGRPLTGLPPFRRARLGLALVPEDRRIFPHLTVVENIAIALSGTAEGRTPSTPEAMIACFPMLQPLVGRMGNQLSGGQQQLLAVARGLVANPRLLLLDEPTEGLAPVIVQQMAASVRDACERAGTGLLLCEQNIWFARQCTDVVYLLDTGRVVFSGSWAAFDADHELKSRHLAV